MLGILLLSADFTTSARAGAVLLQQYASKRFGWAMAETSFLASVKGVVSLFLTAVVLPAVSQVLLVRFRLPPMIKDWWMTIGSLCAAVPGGACLTVAGSSTLFVTSLVILQLGGGYEFTFGGMTSEMVDPSHIAVLFTVHSVFMMLSEVAAGAVLAAVFRKGLELGNGWKALPFFVATILFCVTLVITYSVRLGKHSKR
ncbi:hypothetical protein ISF_02736 [Cordyceps fumosorosea ARSEF 2679]|uniref:Major facilitator superfamily domain, general substrate transporter n=1 Tax=Cordyceps fumosorosea (strain ARSEF 2679) TaxID=1081104 RepID=A0A168B123_CORFA|nr:hypothetical protein ISF_02736 [Cordyceps fumosorosea ARSEF 2679]OAA69466.1 hypothetical protein ISF_02736 [Cordyceps fumosorosea ARSEF 2679]